MKVKIGDELYDSDEEPILLIFTPQERLSMIAGLPNNEMFATFPPGSDIKLIQQWIASTRGFPGGGENMPPLFLTDKQAGGSS